MFRQWLERRIRWAKQETITSKKNEAWKAWTNSLGVKAVLLNEIHCQLQSCSVTNLRILVEAATLQKQDDAQDTKVIPRFVFAEALVARNSRLGFTTTTCVGLSSSSSRRTLGLFGLFGRLHLFDMCCAHFSKLLKASSEPMKPCRSFLLYGEPCAV